MNARLYDRLWKVFMVGESMTGKTAFRTKVCSGVFEEEHSNTVCGTKFVPYYKIAFEFSVHWVTWSDITFKLHLWEMLGL
jgi:GTPase SAR1 family protein